MLTDSVELASTAFDDSTGVWFVLDFEFERYKDSVPCSLLIMVSHDSGPEASTQHLDFLVLTLRYQGIMCYEL